MPAKKTATFGFTTTVPSPSSSEIADTNAYPTLLAGKKMQALVLPADFDASIHQRLHSSGKAKAATVSDLQDLIEAFARKNPSLG
jgi:hypothetical protein